VFCQEGLRKTIKTSDIRCPGRDLNVVPMEHKLEMLPLQPACSVDQMIGLFNMRWR
jgi:hypothetical protein